MNRLIQVFFYGNIFLGICAVALCIETNLLFGFSLNTFSFYGFIFFCTCIYYTRIYVRSVAARNYDDRTLWYRKNFSRISKILTISIIITASLAMFLLVENLNVFLSLSLLQIVLASVFPLLAGWYTFSSAFLKIRKIRLTGWIKPFMVGVIWAGMVTVYPVLIGYGQTVNRDLSVSFILLFLENFLFFSVNAILFDIKDYRTDSFHHLKTYPVIFGVRNTFRFIIFPVLILDFVVFFLFQFHQHFSGFQTLIQLIPHLLLIYIIATHRQQRSVLYYLAAVDGLVFVKAFCGITSIIFFKKY